MMKLAFEKSGCFVWSVVSFEVKASSLPMGRMHSSFSTDIMPIRASMSCRVCSLSVKLMWSQVIPSCSFTREFEPRKVKIFAQHYTNLFILRLHSFENIVREFLLQLLVRIIYAKLLYILVIWNLMKGFYEFLLLAEIKLLAVGELPRKNWL